MPKPTLFFGLRAGDGLLQGEAGNTDDGAAYPFVAQTDRAAPAGTGGECLFPVLYLTVTHETAVALDVTPIIDGVALAPIAVAFAAPAPGAQVTAQVELALSVPVVHAGVERGRVAPRGTWIAVRTESAAPVAGVIAAEVAVAYEVVRESLTAGVPR